MKTNKRSPQQILVFKRLIIALSILIPIVVAGLFSVKIEGYDLSFLPAIYATINGTTAIVLISAVVAVKKKNFLLHERLIKFAITLSAMFLLLYVAYHITSESTTYGGEYRGLYFFILISHILLSIVVVPFVLFTFFQGWKGDYVKHRKIAKITFPLWLYVTISGVIVYLMISPFY